MSPPCAGLRHTTVEVSPEPQERRPCPCNIFANTLNHTPFSHLKKGPRVVVVHLSNRVVFVLYSVHELLDPASLIRRDNLSFTTASTTFRL
jgi:hypothetical protein